MKRLALFALVIAATAVGLSATTSAAGTSTTVRPISDFVSAQGSILRDVGPVSGGELFLGETFIWGNSFSQLFRVDYAGTDDKGLMAVGGPDTHTSFTGTITEKALPDGRALDTIHLVTSNALAFMVNASSFPANCSNGGHLTFVNCPAIFGYSPVELADGIGSPLLVNSVMDVTLVNTAPGAPIPDLVTIAFEPSDSGSYLQTLTLKTTTTGPLRASFGVPDGTPGLGKLNVTIDTSGAGVDNEQTSLKVLG